MCAASSGCPNTFVTGRGRRPERGGARRRILVACRRGHRTPRAREARTAVPVRQSPDRGGGSHGADGFRASALHPQDALPGRYHPYRAVQAMGFGSEGWFKRPIRIAADAIVGWTCSRVQARGGFARPLKPAAGNYRPCGPATKQATGKRKPTVAATGSAQMPNAFRAVLPPNSSRGANEPLRPSPTIAVRPLTGARQPAYFRPGWAQPGIARCLRRTESVRRY